MGKNREVKEALGNVLEENAKNLSASLASNLDNRFRLNLADTEGSPANSSSGGCSPVRKRAHTCPSAGLSA